MRRLKKYESGQGAQYISRKQALKKLQLSLNDFRKLCIIKGVYPREPKNRKKAQKGRGDIQILYHSKDIRFLLHEPIVWTLRDYKIFNRRTGRDRALRDFRNLRRRLANRPELKLDHIVKERYPSFIDAVKDLDDCLTLLFLFSTFPSLRTIPREQSMLCRRLTIEFMHAVIAAKALQKVFISIKGYYFQAEIRGQKVTWIVPHYYPFAPQPKTEVDFKLMSIFVEFYSIMLGFVNYRLYNGLNLIYPPTFPEALVDMDSDESTFVSERIAALNLSIKSTDAVAPDNEEEVIDYELLTQDGDSARIIKMRNELQTSKNLKDLYKGLKFFINREVPREPLVFIIRCFGGEVSWDGQLFAGATFTENDETITHQIVDRPTLGDKYISRDYIQPQWVFDCVNQVELLPTNKYFIGAELPPHLSPFYDYDAKQKEGNDEDDAPKSVEQSEVALDYQLEKAYQAEQEEEEDVKAGGNTEEAELDQSSKMKRKMAVKSGQVHKEDPKAKEIQDIQEHNLTARMVKGRHRNIYKKLLKERRDKKREVKILDIKRQRIQGKGPAESNEKPSKKKRVQ